MHKARKYGFDSSNSDVVQRALKAGKREVFHRVNTAGDKIPVLYIFSRINKAQAFRTFLVIKTKQGDSFCGGVSNMGFFEMIHAHAIKRYMERRKFTGTLEQAQNKILSELFANWAEPDRTDGTIYIYYDGGIFLCTWEEEQRVLHLRTFIMNRQCSPMQRMMSLKSEKGVNEFKKSMGMD